MCFSAIYLRRTANLQDLSCVTDSFATVDLATVDLVTANRRSVSFAGVLTSVVLLQIVLAVVIARPVAAQELGMDPGMELDSAVQSRRGNRFFLQQRVSDRNYQLIAVAEQGGLQDSRPFEIINSLGSGKEDYQAASNRNVSPFFFEWNHSLGGLSASLEVDTASAAYFYRNRPGLDNTPTSPSLRDQARTIYREIPADIGNAGLPQLKNSLDDFVHMAFFESDGATATEFLNGLETLSYSLTLRAGRTQLEHPFNYQQADGGAQLKPRTGSRIVASIHWSEDRDSNGVHEVYLIEINVGGVSSNPAWQTGQRCAQDLETHADVISGQYLVLGGEVLLAGQGLPLRDNQVQSLTIDWGRLLRQLSNTPEGSPCHLNATLEAVPNTMGLGVALEARGGVVQSLEIAGATAHRENSLSLSPNITNVAAAPSSEETGVVQVQSASADNSVAATSGTTNTGATEPQALPDFSAAAGQPYISGLEIRLPLALDTTGTPLSQGTWWQIQSADDWSPRCTGINETVGATTGTANELSCEVLPGRYTVIEHVSGTRWDNLSVLHPTETTGPRDLATSQFDGLVFNQADSTLSWTQPGWYQVQRESDYVSICESSGFCVLEAGVYQVINHTSGRVWSNFVVVQQ